MTHSLLHCSRDSDERLWHRGHADQRPKRKVPHTTPPSSSPLPTGRFPLPITVRRKLHDGKIILIYTVIQGLTLTEVSADSECVFPHCHLFDCVQHSPRAVVGGRGSGKNSDGGEGPTDKEEVMMILYYSRIKKIIMLYYSSIKL